MTEHQRWFWRMSSRDRLEGTINWRGNQAWRMLKASWHWQGVEFLRAMKKVEEGNA